MKKPKMLVVAIFAKVPSVEIGNGDLKLHLEVLLKGRNSFIIFKIKFRYFEKAKKFGPSSTFYLTLLSSIKS